MVVAFLMAKLKPVTSTAHDKHMNGRTVSRRHVKRPHTVWLGEEDDSSSLAKRAKKATVSSIKKLGQSESTFFAKKPMTIDEQRKHLPIARGTPE